jgi:L-threonylcarbamoyladenylate synthase
MNQTDISRAIHTLKNGDTIIFPTDTLYALGADIFNTEAVKKVYIIKHRPFSLPLPVAVASSEEIESVAVVDKIAQRIIDRFLPGTLTIVLKKQQIVPAIVTSGEENIAIRVPNNRIALQLLKEFGPLTVTSANIHNQKTPSVIKDILMQLQIPIQVCLDSGPLSARPSTIVDLTTPRPQIIRPGMISEKELLEAITNG